MTSAGLRLCCIALVLALGCGSEDRSRTPAPVPVARAPADPEGRLDPAPYRAEIEAAESLLYGSDSLDQDGWRALSKALLDLHNQIVFRDSSPSARETSGRMFFFSARADAATVLRKSEAELAELRGLWEQLCSDKFAPASWIRAERVTR